MINFLQCAQQGAIEFAPSISTELRSLVVSKGEICCQMCGTAPGDIDEITGRPARFRVDQLADREKIDDDNLSHLVILCSSCEQGMKELAAEKKN